MSSEKTREVWRRARRKYRLAHPERVRQRRNQERIRREAVRLWMQGHPERHEAHRQTWEKAHPESKRVYDGRRRARLVGNGGSHTEKQWIALCWLLLLRGP